MLEVSAAEETTKDWRGLWQTVESLTEWEICVEICEA